MVEVTTIKTRDGAIDLLKFIAIYLVILGHCLGRLGLGMGVLDHPFGKLIVMVNMPLFIFISGYFGQSLYKRGFFMLLASKYKTLIRPCIIYSILCALICDFFIEEGPSSIIGGGKVLIDRIVSTYWFIWVLLYCSFYSWAFVKLGERINISPWGRMMLLVLSMFILIPIPDTKFIPHLYYFKAMYPFFLLGLGSRRFQLLNRAYEKRKIVLPVCILGYFICFMFFKGNYSFYCFALTPFPQVAIIYLLMLVAGCIGIIGIYCFARRVYEQKKKKQWLVKLTGYGQYTLAIYMIQGFVVEIMDCYPDYLCISNSLLLTIVAVILSFILTILCVIIVDLFRKNKTVSAYLLGK